MTHDRSFIRRTVLLAATSAALASFAGCGTAMGGGAPAMPTFRAMLAGTSEVPPTTSSGTGTYEATLDKATGMLKWKLNYTGLTGPATMAHIHGPAMPGTNAGVIVPFPSPASPSEGSATLTPAQVADLMAGKWYVNVHTQRNPGGEIRGQLMAN